MTKTQIQLPDDLYREAKRVAKEREISLAEVMRRGLEYITRVYPPLKPPGAKCKAWKFPDPLKLGLKVDPFADPNWRVKLETAAAIESLKYVGRLHRLRLPTRGILSDAVTDVCLARPINEGPNSDGMLSGPLSPVPRGEG